MVEEELKKKYVDALEEIKILKKKNKDLLEDATAATKSQICAIQNSIEMKRKNDILLTFLGEKEKIIDLYKGKIIDMSEENNELKKKNKFLEEEVKLKMQLSKTIISLRKQIEEQNLIIETRLKEIHEEKIKSKDLKDSLKREKQDNNIKDNEFKDNNKKIEKFQETIDNEKQDNNIKDNQLKDNNKKIEKFQETIDNEENKKKELEEKLEEKENNIKILNKNIKEKDKEIEKKNEELKELRESKKLLKDEAIKMKNNSETFERIYIFTVIRKFISIVISKAKSKDIVLNFPLKEKLWNYRDKCNVFIHHKGDYTGIDNYTIKDVLDKMKELKNSNNFKDLKILTKEEENFIITKVLGKKELDKLEEMKGEEPFLSRSLFSYSEYDY